MQLALQQLRIGYFTVLFVFLVIREPGEKRWQGVQKFTIVTE